MYCVWPANFVTSQAKPGGLFVELSFSSIINHHSSLLIHYLVQHWWISIIYKILGNITFTLWVISPSHTKKYAGTGKNYNIVIVVILYPVNKTSWNFSWISFELISTHILNLRAKNNLLKKIIWYSDIAFQSTHLLFYFFLTISSGCFMGIFSMFQWSFKNDFGLPNLRGTITMSWSWQG